MDMEQARFNMVEQQIRPCDIQDDVLRELLFKLKREKFAPEQYKKLAFSDLEIPLPGGQKMLLPRIEAMLLQQLKLSKTDKVLEIGTGSGYVTALLAKQTDFVYSVEVEEQNKQLATYNLTYAGINNVSVIHANAINGLADKAPFDKIFIGGGLLSIPNSIKSQLKIGGKLVGIVGTRPIMHAVLVERIAESQYTEKKLFETDVDYLISENVEQFKF